MRISSITTRFLGLLCIFTALSATGEQLFGPGDDPATWSSPLRDFRAKQRFEALEFHAENGRIFWSFTPRRGFDGSGLDLNRKISRATGFSVRLRNLSPVPVKLSLFTTDNDRNQWQSGSVTLPTQMKEMQTFRFDRKGWRLQSVTSESRAEDLAWPLPFLRLACGNFQPGVSYQLEIEQLESERIQPELASLSGIQLPETVNAGATFSASPQLELKQPVTVTAARLVLLAGDGRFSCSTALPWQGKQGRSFSSESMLIRIPQFLAGGEYRLSLHLQGSDAQGNSVDADYPVRTLRLIPRRPAADAGTAAVKLHNGVPTFFFDGKPHSGISYMSYAPSETVARNFHKVGINLFSFVATPTDSTRDTANPAWIAPEKFDFTQLDQRAMTFLNAAPDARLIIRLVMSAPVWWCRQHPEETVKIRKEDGTITEFYAYTNRNQPNPAPSWASDRWRHDTLAALEKLIRHVETSPYADRVAGYHLGSGPTDEWLLWTDRKQGGRSDFSTPNIRKFRAWLKEKYGNDEALRHAWHNDAVTLETAEIPDTRSRETSRFGVLRHPRLEQQVIDYSRYASDLTAETILLFTRAARCMTGGRKAIGVFYGYLMYIPERQDEGHFSLGKVLADDSIDFLASPSSYRFRQTGGAGTSHFMSPVGSVRLHGKLWIDENDIRTSISYKNAGVAWGQPSDLAGDRLQQSKELANVIVNGCGSWWFNVASNRYDHPEIQKLIANLVRCADRSVALDRTPVDRFAVVLDATGPDYLRTGGRTAKEFLLERLPALSRSGAAFGHYIADDLDRLTDHKLLIFPFSIAPDPKQRQALDKLKNNNRILVFFNGADSFPHRPGVQKGKNGAFTGIRVAKSRHSIPGDFTFTDVPGFTDGLAGKQFGNAKKRIDPAFLPDAPNMVVLARDSQNNPVVAMKKYPGWTAVYCTQIALPARFWVNLAAAAGVHRYIDTPDVVWANRSQVAVCVDQPGKRTIRLPEPRRVREMFSGQTVSNSPVSSFDWEFSRGETALFELMQ